MNAYQKFMRQMDFMYKIAEKYAPYGVKESARSRTVSFAQLQQLFREKVELLKERPMRSSMS